MKCLHCLSDIPDGTSKCPKCGSDFAGADYVLYQAFINDGIITQPDDDKQDTQRDVSTS